MKRLYIVLLLIITSAFFHEVQSAGYMKYDGIDGESEDAGHEQWIDILAIDYSLIQPRDHASGMASGKRQHKPLTITKPVDKATPLLMKAIGNNEIGKKVTIELVRIDPKSQREETYFRIELEDVRITSVSVSGGGSADEPPTEEVAFYYSKITWTYLPEGIDYTEDWSGR